MARPMELNRAEILDILRDCGSRGLLILAESVAREEANRPAATQGERMQWQERALNLARAFRGMGG